MATTPSRSWGSSSLCTRDTATSTVFDCQVLEDRPGLIAAEITGESAERLFSKESGGHRWQRIPPNERRGRRHTSTVTVAVLPVRSEDATKISEKDVEWEAMRGSGAGGQARNKTSNAVRARHIPTGTTVRVETSRSQHLNREAAFRWLASEIASAERKRSDGARASERRGQIGSGQRGDKIRTIRLQDGIVVDHQTGKRMNAAKYLRGQLGDLL